MIETLDPLDADRKCFRMVNGVLVERTVKDVLPTLKTNSDGLKQVIEDMLKQYKSKQNELDNWKVRAFHGSWDLHPRHTLYEVDMGRTDVSFPPTEKEQYPGCAALKEIYPPIPKPSI